MHEKLNDRAMSGSVGGHASILARETSENDEDEIVIEDRTPAYLRVEKPRPARQILGELRLELSRSCCADTAVSTARKAPRGRGPLARGHGPGLSCTIPV